MQKRYQYCMSGMFAATDQNYYEINIPSPHTYETEEEAMADGAFGYRFVLLPGGKGPQVVIFEGSGFRLVCDGKENYIKDWVEGDIVGIYDFDEFTKAGIVALSIMFAVFLIRILSDRILSFITYYFM